MYRRPSFYEKRAQYIKETLQQFARQKQSTENNDEGFCADGVAVAPACELTCTRCGHDSATPCSLCKVTLYCGTTCQKEDGPFHRSFCGVYARTSLSLDVLRDSDTAHRQAIVVREFSTLACCCDHDYRKFIRGGNMALVRRGGMEFLVGKRCFLRFGDQAPMRLVNCRPFMVDHLLRKQ